MKNWKNLFYFSLTCSWTDSKKIAQETINASRRDPNFLDDIPELGSPTCSDVDPVHSIRPQIKRMQTEAYKKISMEGRIPNSRVFSPTFFTKFCIFFSFFRFKHFGGRFLHVSYFKIFAGYAVFLRTWIHRTAYLHRLVTPPWLRVPLEVSKLDEPLSRHTYALV